MKIVRDSTGKISYVEWIEGPTKTRQGGLKKRRRPAIQKLIRTEEPHCPITYFEKVLSKRPSEIKFGGPLYLTSLCSEQEIGAKRKFGSLVSLWESTLSTTSRAGWCLKLD